jgi:tetratricopeptide (TPR) repeat protein
MTSRRNQSLLLLALLLMVHCGKKSGTDESVMIRSEAARMSTDVTTVDWLKTLVVQSFTRPPGSPSDQSVLAAELTDEVISRLSRARELKVVRADSYQAAQRLRQKTDYILTGESEWIHPDMALTVHLVDVRKGIQLWENTFSITRGALFTAADRTADTLLQKLHLAVAYQTGMNRNDIREDAMNAYLEGKRYLKKNNRIAADLAVQSFKKTLRSDSTFVPAWLGLGQTYIAVYDNGWDRNLVWFHLAQQTSNKVLQMDSTCSRARFILGRVYQGFGNLQQAEEQYRKALEFNSSAEEAWLGLGNVLVEFGLYLPALDVFNRTLELNPTQTRASTGKALVMIGLRHYAEAEDVLRRTLAAQPDILDVHPVLALARFFQNDLSGAQAELNRGSSEEKAALFSRAVQAMVYAKQEKSEKALEELEMNIIPALHDEASLFVAVAAVYSLIDRPGLCVQWLEKAKEYGYKQYPWLENDPSFKAMRNDARFQGIMTSIRDEWKKRALGER